VDEGGSGRVFEGVPYGLLDGRLEEHRFRAAFDPNQLWTDWCTLQTPYPTSSDPDTGYGCLPNWGFTYARDGSGCSQPNPDTGEDVAVDCGKLSLCTHISPCTCTADGCFVTANPSVTFDIALDGDVADGTVTGLADRLNIRLERASD
jgi:hypothetical protein